MAKTHKYLYRIGTPGHYKYFYSEEAYYNYMLDKSFGKNLKAWNEEFARESKLRKANDRMAFAVKKLDQTKLSSRPVKTHKAESLVDKLRNKSYASISSISENVKKFADNLVNKTRNVAYSVIASLGRFGKKVKTRLEKESKHWQEIKDADRNAGSKLNRYGSAF